MSGIGSLLSFSLSYSPANRSGVEHIVNQFRRGTGGKVRCGCAQGRVRPIKVGAPTIRTIANAAKLSAISARKASAFRQIEGTTQ